MANSQTLTGHRVVVSIDGKEVGIFNSCSHSHSNEAEPLYILGRSGPADIVYKGITPVEGSLSGWRIVGQGAYVQAKFVRPQDLLTAPPATLTLYDRQTTQVVSTITGVRFTGLSTGFQSRGVIETSVSFIGMMVSDESGKNSEGAGATQLPPGAEF